MAAISAIGSDALEAKRRDAADSRYVLSARSGELAHISRGGRTFKLVLHDPHAGWRSGACAAKSWPTAAPRGFTVGRMGGY